MRDRRPLQSTPLPRPADAHAPHRTRASLLMPDEARSVYPRALWGTTAADLSPPQVPHVHIRLIRAPEGALLVACCGGCGGREEELVDARGRGGVAAAARHSGESAVAAALHEASLAAVLAVTRQWVPLHAGCARTPLEFALPASVRDFVDAVDADARAHLGAGIPVPAAISLLLSSGEAITLGIGDVPGTSEDDPHSRGIVLAERHGALRDYCRRHAVAVIAAVACGEAWVRVPQADGTVSDRADREVLVVSVVTQTHGRMQLADITRAGTSDFTGPATVAAASWHPLADRSALMDGLAARLDRLSPGTEALRDDA